MPQQLPFRRIAISPPAMLPAELPVWAARAQRLGADALLLRPVGWLPDVVEAVVWQYSNQWTATPHSPLPFLLNWQPIHYQWPVSGWHLKQNGDWSAVPNVRNFWLGQSCHDLASVQRAECAGADYVLLSPIFPTHSHIGMAGMGLAMLETIAQQTQVPIFALGGIESSNEAACLSAGAYGVAAIRCFNLMNL